MNTNPEIETLKELLHVEQQNIKNLLHYAEGREGHVPVSGAAVEVRDAVIGTRKELDQAHHEALHLAKSIHVSEYHDVTNWEPLDTVPGLISQIDNMYAGIREQRDFYRMKAEELAALHP